MENEILERVDEKDINLQVKTGEIYKFTYAIGKLTDSACEDIQKFIADKAEHYKIINTYFNFDNNEYIMYLQVKDNPFPFLIVFGALASIALTGLFFMSLKKVEKVIQSPTIKSTLTNVFIIAIIVACALLIHELKGW